jgi:hypothetical protein
MVPYPDDSHGPRERSGSETGPSSVAERKPGQMSRENNCWTDRNKFEKERRRIGTVAGKLTNEA